jgi:hypothetical protein
MSLLAEIGGLADSLFGTGTDVGRSLGREYKDIYNSPSYGAGHSAHAIVSPALKFMEGSTDPNYPNASYAGMLPPALQYAVNSMKGMANIEAVGGLDTLTSTGISALDQLSETLTGRGDIVGGQRTQQKQQLRDRLLQAMLETRRSAASAAAGYEADIYKGYFQDALKVLQWAGSGFGGAPAGADTSPSQSTLGSQIGSIGDDLVSSIVGMISGGSLGGSSGSSGFSLNNPGGGDYTIPGIKSPDDPFWQLRG